MRWVLGVCVGVIALAQTPASPPQISAFYKDAKGAAYYKWLILDPPFSMTIDANQSPHLSLPILATDEVPRYQEDTGTWLLLHTPLTGTLECWRNGAYQTRTPEPGHTEFTPDYSVSGAIISSPSWAQLSADGSVDVHRCRYEY